VLQRWRATTAAGLPTELAGRKPHAECRAAEANDISTKVLPDGLLAPVVE
jgi:hypothetical protein